MRERRRVRRRSSGSCKEGRRIWSNGRKLAGRDKARGCAGLLVRRMLLEEAFVGIAIRDRRRCSSVAGAAAALSRVDVAVLSLIGAGPDMCRSGFVDRQYLKALDLRDVTFQSPNTLSRL